jgi:SNF family Na+-dependent transporter
MIVIVLKDFQQCAIKMVAEHFLFPFLVCLFIIGMPCMYLELAAGQYFQCGNITIWGKMNPYMKGIGYAVFIINILMLSYYNTLQAYA